MARRSLWPREHGAYFQLAFPLLTAYVLRAPSTATLALGAGAVLAFLANEPLLVVLGHRGVRRKSIDGARARRRLAILAGGAAVLGGLGLALAPHAVIAAAIVAAPTAALLGFAWRRAEHTLAGEIMAAVALTGASAPLLVASGATLSLALEVWLGWAVGFGASVIAVHRVIARHKRAASWIDRALPVAMIAVLAAGLAAGSRSFAITTPLVVLAAGLVTSPPSAAKLRAIGVAIVVAAIASSALVLIR
jgi:hypothetical protein